MFPPVMLRLMIGFLKKHKGLIGLTLGSSIFTFLVESVVIPRILSNTFNNIATPGELRKNLMYLVFSWILTQTGSGLNDWCLGRIEPALSKYMSQIIFDQLFIAYENEHENMNTADIIEKISTIQTTFERMLYRIIFSLFPRFVTIFAILANICSINSKIGAYTFVLLVAFLTIAILWNQRNKGVMYDSMKARSRYTEKVSDVFSNIELVHATPGALDNEKNTCVALNNVQEDTEYIAQQSIRITQLIMYTFNVVIFVVLLYVMYNMYSKGELTNEKITSILLAISPLFNNMAEIMYYIPDVVKLLSVLNYQERFVDHLMAQPEQSGIHSSLTTNDIVFDRVTFGYNDTPIFKHLSLTIPSGSYITLRGPSGSGKTSFLKLLFRIEAPQSGSIHLGGQPLHDLHSLCVKQHIMYLHQHSTLLNDTVYHNMTYGVDESPRLRPRIEELLTKYQLISLFTDKSNFEFLDETVGILGEKLSGGQRQVVHLIRCMVHTSAPFLILDEPTSAVDRHHKTIINDMIRDLHQAGKTILVISHDDVISSPYILDFTHTPTLVKNQDF